MEWAVGYVIRFLAWVRGEEAPTARPPIKWVDQSGIGWREHPSYQDADQLDAGQHETWKREMRVFLWRAVRVLEDVNSPYACPGSIDLRLLDLGDRRESTPRLYPCNVQLADACQRLGFRRLAGAACVDEVDQGTVGGIERLRAIYDAHEQAVLVEVERMRAAWTATAATWDEARMGRPFVHDEPEALVKMMSLGSWDHTPVPWPLKPIQLVSATGNSGSGEQFTARRRGRA